MTELENLKKACSMACGIIVKNDPEGILRAIRSANRVCSRVYVCDTGSDDNTPQIASSEGADLFFHKWQDDFSAARNFLLRQIREPWILILDSDESLDIDSLADARDFLREILSHTENYNCGGLNLKIKNFIGEKFNSEKFSIHYYTRIFRNRPNIRFEGRVHEQIRTSIESAGLEIRQIDKTILHFGYINPSADKKQRNLDLIEKTISENAGDSFFIFHKAETLFSMELRKEAEAEFQKALEIQGLSPEQKHKAKIRLAQLAVGKDEHSKVIELLDFAADDVQLEGLRRYVLSASLMSQKRFADALRALEHESVDNSGLVDRQKVALALENLKIIVRSGN